MKYEFVWRLFFAVHFLAAFIADMCVCDYCVHVFCVHCLPPSTYTTQLSIYSFQPSLIPVYSCGFSQISIRFIVQF